MNRFSGSSHPSPGSVVPPSLFPLPSPTGSPVAGGASESQGVTGSSSNTVGNFES